MSSDLNKVVFLDRDGVINREKENYITSCKDFELLPQVGEILKKIQDKGFLLIVITNQSAINRGFSTHDEVTNIHNLMKEELQKFGVTISAVYYCPHRPDENCDCRKPKTKLISIAIEEHDVDIGNSWFIGDKDSDIIAGKQIGLQTLKIERNGSLEQVLFEIENDHAS